MSQNVHTCHVSRLSSISGLLGMMCPSSCSSAAMNGSGSMNPTNSSQSASWSHNPSGCTQNAAGLASNQHGAAPGTPSEAEYDTNVATAPSPPSSGSSHSTTLKEHDLLGLSDVSSSNSTMQDPSVQRSGFLPEGLNLNLNLGAIELRLGPQDVKDSLKTGDFLGLDAGGQGTEFETQVPDRRASNVDQNVASVKQQEQCMGRGLGYSCLSEEGSSIHGGRADVTDGTACRPLIESESLQKRHGAVDRKTSDESYDLSMSMSQQQEQVKRPTNHGNLAEKVYTDMSYKEKAQEVIPHQQQLVSEEDHAIFPVWQERCQHTIGQDATSPAEKGVMHELVMSGMVSPLELQQGVEQLERGKRNVADGKTLAALQLPEQRFSQDSSPAERSPRHSEYLVQQQLWQSQLLMRSADVCRHLGAAEFQAQQQHMSLPPPQEDNPRNGFSSPHNGNIAGLRGVFPASKSAVSGSKRPFDTIGSTSESRSFNESRVSSVSENPASINNNSAPASDADVKSKAQSPSYQSWGTKAPTWQMLHSGGSFGPFPSQAPVRNQSTSKSTVEVSTGGGDGAQNAWESHTKSLQQQNDPSVCVSRPISSSPSENKLGPAQTSSPLEAASAPRAAPSTHAVGWPPLRSFRKSTIAAHPRPAPVETHTRPAPPAPPQAASPASVASQPNSWFVKVYMDGVPFGRKVDLKMNRSYEKLSLALEDMFRGFVNGQQSSRDVTLPSDKRNFLHGSDYVLTYEDQDGDLMLVGDVPWTMFIDTVKRLRIMKGSEAIGLGTRAAEKVNKVQPIV